MRRATKIKCLTLWGVTMRQKVVLRMHYKRTLAALTWKCRDYIISLSLLRFRKFVKLIAVEIKVLNTNVCRLALAKVIISPAYLHWYWHRDCNIAVASWDRGGCRNLVAVLWGCGGYSDLAMDVVTCCDLVSTSVGLRWMSWSRELQCF